MKAVLPEDLDLAEVRGQECAKRALEVAVAGGHHLLMIGPPGAGKTMLAERVPSLLPPLSEAEAAEITEIHARSRRRELPILRRPFRRPPPETTMTAMIGGGRGSTPGEVSLAHQGVLFLDDLPLFRRQTLDALRGPLEAGRVALPGSGPSRSLPARFLLIGTMNACPCGWRYDDSSSCRCSPPKVERYLRPLAGAVLDRIDLGVLVPNLKLQVLRSSAGESSETVALRVAAARAVQMERCGQLNAALDPDAVRVHCRPNPAARTLLERGAEKLRLSARAVSSLLRIARTLADLGGSEEIRTFHVAEALQGKTLACGWPYAPCKDSGRSRQVEDD